MIKIFKQLELIKVFQDTQHYYTSNKYLQNAVLYSRKNTKLFTETIQLNPSPHQNPCSVSLLDATTADAARTMSAQYSGQRIAVLNFASPTSPGGGVMIGAAAQEEDLCRCSTLYPSIDRKWLRKEYYKPNSTGLATDACIYSPNVIVCKDSNYKRLSDGKFATVNVISCAAPDLRKQFARNLAKNDPDSYRNMLCKRINYIFQVAALTQNNILVLGAFGCGVFENDPYIISSIFMNAIEQYCMHFSHIVFAIPVPKNTGIIKSSSDMYDETHFGKEYRSANYLAFKKALESYL